MGEINKKNIIKINIIMANKKVGFSDVVRSASGYEYPIGSHGYGTSSTAWGYDNTNYQTPEEHQAAKDSINPYKIMERFRERTKNDRISEPTKEANQEMKINPENNTITFCNALGVCTAIAVTAGLAAKLTGFMGGKTKRNKKNKRKYTRRRR